MRRLVADAFDPNLVLAAHEFHLPERTERACVYLCRPLYFAMYGCDGVGDGLETYIGSTGRLEDEPCDNEPMPVTAFCFFAFFIFVAGFLMLNLFIGVILVMLQNVTGRFSIGRHD